MKIALKNEDTLQKTRGYFSKNKNYQIWKL